VLVQDSWGYWRPIGPNQGDENDGKGHFVRDGDGSWFIAAAGRRRYESRPWGCAA
jgi:hypothetical protein